MSVLGSQGIGRLPFVRLEVQRKLRFNEHLNYIPIALLCCHMEYIHSFVVGAEDVNAFFSEDPHDPSMAIEAGDPEGVYSLMVSQVDIDKLILQHQTNKFSTNQELLKIKIVPSLC